MGGHEIEVVKSKALADVQCVEIFNAEKSLETFDPEMYKGIDIGAVGQGIRLLHKILTDKRGIIIRLICCIVADLKTR